MYVLVHNIKKIRIEMRVVCINDTKLPNGANITEGQEYEVTEKFVNFADQVVYIIAGVVNEGRTQFDMPWHGYNAERFTTLDNVADEVKEVNYAMN